MKNNINLESERFTDQEKAKIKGQDIKCMHELVGIKKEELENKMDIRGL